MWVEANSNLVITEDDNGDYWCPQCEDHPSRLEQRDEHDASTRKKP
jgi:hypothetical protein